MSLKEARDLGPQSTSAALPRRRRRQAARPCRACSRVSAAVPSAPARRSPLPPKACL